MRFLCLFLLFYFNCFSLQTVQADSRFAHVDKHVKEISGKMIYHPDVLVKTLTEPFDDEEEKARALFAWIAINIEYNYVAFKNNVELVQTTNEVLLSGKAMCYGFSLLFQEFCEKAGLHCEIIEGYAKGLGYEKGQKFEKPNHAWNAVMLNDQWYLMDVTWAAGTPGELMIGKRRMDLDSYFMTAPDQFLKTHLPQDPTWQLRSKKQTLADFEDGKKIYGEDESINPYHPRDYSGLDEYQKDILQFKRASNFNPENIQFTIQLSFAYIYMANSITDGLRDMAAKELYNKAEDIENEFEAYMDSAWQIIDPLPLIRIQKNRAIIQDEINYQKGVLHYELAAEMFNKGYNNKLSLSLIKKKVMPHFSLSKKRFEDVPSNSIYGKDAREYLEIISKYESRLTNSALN